ncbi:helix-turn-helix domain-containing protein [Actinokineospora iranica]|uniref:Helix-turn-helix domain-containing protein n=1 Tax=Actinokineospora iranica TaxID=1271860 RepID=A0A1G6Y955_9PSEU|nr:helix-turn-helix transcriptional regulator [Actinokineospora iranica]SDD86116.1 Helix-turn-helix domain-containing protein [Actinokineospora iranica]
MSADDSDLPPWPLGPYLSAAREQARLSIAATARRSGVSQGKILQLERGYMMRGDRKVPVGTTKLTVEKVARAVGADVAEALRLVGITTDDPSRPGRRVAGNDLSQVSDGELAAELHRLTAELNRVTDELSRRLAVHSMNAE